MLLLHTPRITRQNKCVNLNKPLSIVLISLLCCVAWPAQAQTQTQTSPLNAIYACASIVDDTERLACFDKNVPIIKVKEEKKEIITIDEESAKEIERDSFGFSLPSLPKLGILKPKSEKSKSSTKYFQVKSITNSRKGVTITMENDHVWRQISGDIGIIPKGTVTAKVKPGTLGTFFISLKNENGKSSRKGARFKRVE